MLHDLWTGFAWIVWQPIRLADWAARNPAEGFFLIGLAGVVGLVYCAFVVTTRNR